MTEKGKKGWDAPADREAEAREATAAVLATAAKDDGFAEKLVGLIVDNGLAAQALSLHNEHKAPKVKVAKAHKEKE